MFHVERHSKLLLNKGLASGFICLFFLLSCIGLRPTTQIQDYVLVPNGIEILGQKRGLTAFVFENNTKNLPIEKYFSMKFASDNYYQREFWVSIEKNKFKIVLYDNSDFEKYFSKHNFSVINLEPENAREGNQSAFIAISMITNSNEDCLSDSSLFQNIAVTYLKKLKEEYYNQ